MTSDNDAPRAIQELRVSEIEIGDRRRKPDPAKVDSLAKSMEQIGQRVPISVRRDGEKTILVNRRASIRSAYPWLRHIFADGGYAGDKLKGALGKLGT